MAPPLIELHGAAFGYGGRPVVSGVDLAVGRGELFGLLGPNGSGKTTLFRGMLGLIPPLAGQVVRRAAVGYVPQREGLDAIYPLTVEEVVHMGAYGRLSGLRGLARAERELALRWLERVGLADRRRRLFASLSGGQRQRGLIARALMARPELLLLDEPTSGVDREAQRAIQDVLLELRAEGMAILLVSHQLEVVREVVRDALWIEDGRVRRGTLDEFLARQGAARPELGLALGPALDEGRRP
jgi:ABC-type Mn2+/Zn2+ transport system ATPase subunit